MTSDIDLDYARRCNIKASWRYEIRDIIPCSAEEEEIYGVHYKKSKDKSIIFLDKIHTKDTNSAVYRIHYMGYGKDDEIELFYSTLEAAKKCIFEKYPDAKLIRNWEVPDK